MQTAPSGQLGFHLAAQAELDRHSDEWGESFQFKVNGKYFRQRRKLGACGLPDSRIATADYERLIGTPKANMNMLRLWEADSTTRTTSDTLNKLGILIWHDFMFAYSTYPPSTSNSWTMSRLNPG